MADVQIRLADRDDLAPLGALLVTQLREHHVDLADAAIVAAAEGTLLRPQRGRFLLAIEAGRLVGFAALSFLWTLEHGGWAAWLDELYVVPERRGDGVGARLLAAAVDLARAIGAKAVDLEIEADHQRAAGLYRRHGFAPLTRSRWSLHLANPNPNPSPDPNPSTNTNTETTGGCFCGAVRYRITAPPIEVSHCHCGICRRTTGAPFVTWATVPAVAFTYTAGTPGVVRSTPTAERQFCSGCGTALTFREHARLDWVDVAVGSLDDPNAVRPDEHIWTTSQLGWLSVDDDLPRHPRQGPSG